MNALVDILNLSASLWMTAIVWVMQRVHYPVFALIGQSVPPDQFVAFSRAHGSKISLGVIPAMLIELAVAGRWWSHAITQDETLLASSLNLISVIFTWCITLLWSARAHQKFLTEGYSPSTYQSLMRSNQARLALWTVRSIGLFIFWVGHGH